MSRGNFPGASVSEAQRLVWWARQCARTQTAFAVQVGVPIAYMRHVLRGRQRISRDVAERIHEATGVSLEWLLRGTGTPWGLTTPTTTPAPEPPEVEVVVRPGFWCGACNERVPEGAEQCPHCYARLIWPAKDEGAGK
jgi:hypothetical protein